MRHSFTFRHLSGVRVSLLAVFMAISLSSAAAGLQDRTLRVDYIFSGTAGSCTVSLAEMSSFDGWAGRTVNMDRTHLRGNGSIVMKDAATGDVLYANTFSTLFHEWQVTQEATEVSRGFENVFLLPMPSSPADVTVEVYDFKGNTAATLTHRVNPADILIRSVGNNPPRSRYIVRSGPSSECIDVVIVAEGYAAGETSRFYRDAQAAWDALLTHEPFRSRASSFNVLAVPLVSNDSGVSIPGKGIWKETVLGSHFDTFYSDRYLTTLRLRRLHDALSGLPYEHIIILANTDNYGGGGIFNSYTLTTSRGPRFERVVVHEFGHSFAGLADEYYYDDQYSPYYFPDVEPWEQNITTGKDTGSKWADLTGKDGVGMYEGGGYQSKGVWRACEDCRMKTNTADAFCPVCERAIGRIIDFYTKQQ